MLDGKAHCAVDMVFPFVAWFTGKSKRFGADHDLNEMSVQFFDLEYKVLVSHREIRWVDKELLKLRSQTEELKHIFHRVSAMRCTSVMYTLKFHLFDHLVGGLKKFESMSFTDAALFEHSDVPAKHHIPNEILTAVDEKTRDCAEYGKRGVKDGRN